MIGAVRLSTAPYVRTAALWRVSTGVWYTGGGRAGARRARPPEPGSGPDQKKFWHSVNVMPSGQTLIEEVMLLKP
jgi:hypothetical protein